MVSITYGYEVPTEPISKATHYVNLTTNYMYEQVGGVWVLRFKHGMPVDEHGNVIKDYLHY